MARKSKNGVNKSEEIRQQYVQNPKIKAKEVVAALKAKGIDVTTGLVYLVKGKMQGMRKRKRRATANATSVAVAAGNPDALATIIKVKKLAVEVGGMRTLRAIIEALSE